MSAEGHWDQEAQILMLQLQVEQLQTELEREVEGHRKANARAAASEKRNKTLKEHIAFMEDDLSSAAYCWNCSSIGETEKCEKCGNNAVFIWNGCSYDWRGLPKRRKSDDRPSSLPASE